jgi:hypothetical protein
LVGLFRPNYLDAQTGKKLAQRVAVIDPVADEFFRESEEKTGFEGGFNQFHLMRRSALHVSGDKETRGVFNDHDLRAFAPPRLAYSGSPLFAGEKVPSPKPL